MAAETSLLRPKVYLPPGPVSGKQQQVSLVLFSNLRKNGAQHAFQGFLATPVFQPDTAADLEARLTSLLRNELVVGLYYRGVYLDSHEKLWLYLPDMHDKSPRFTVVTVKGDSALPVEVTVKSFDRHPVKFSINSSETVGTLKKHILDPCYPLDAFRVIFNGRYMQEHRPVCFYFTEPSTVHLICTLRGGGAPPPAPQLFVDVTNSAAIQKVKFSIKAPKWRVATKGLNIEGRCQNAQCTALGKMVVCKKGAGVFTLGTTSCRCPLCGSDVEPVTSAFYDCAWMYDGVKTGGEEVRSPWTVAGDQYERFRESGNMINWDRLVLTVSLDTSVKPSAPLWPGAAAVANECGICLDSFKGHGALRPAKVSACGHTFHRDCLEKWTCFSTNCPLCRRDLVSGRV